MDDYPDSLDLSFLEEDICSNPKCVYIGTYFCELSCSHTLCIEHILSYSSCPTCSQEIVLNEIRIPENMPGYQLIKTMFTTVEEQRISIANLNNENVALQEKLAEYQETLEFSLNRQYYLIEECKRLSPKKPSVPRLSRPYSGRESPIILQN